MNNYTEYKTLKVTELIPNDSHVSFYGKAKVIETETEHGNIVYFLQSYETIVAAIDGNEFIRLWDGWSATTGRHIKAFTDRYYHEIISKKQWDKMEVAYVPSGSLLQPFNWNRVNVNYGYPVWEW